MDFSAGLVDGSGSSGLSNTLLKSGLGGLVSAYVAGQELAVRPTCSLNEDIYDASRRGEA